MAGPSGLPWGADDFVSKPFRVPELLGRVRTQLRASGQLRDARAALRDAAAELERARGDAVNNRRLIDILHEVTGELSPPRSTEFSRGAWRRRSRSLTARSFWRAPANRRAPSPPPRRIREFTTSRSTSTAIRRSPRRSSPDHAVLVDDTMTHPLFAEMRDVWTRERKKVVLQSVAAVPFAIDRVAIGRAVSAHRPRRARA